jgi:misacylated tRNA(Ala) deacylase
MTNMLFLDDSYLRACDATVLEHTEDGCVVCDQTIFYPTGGGQPCDEGSLTDGNSTWSVSSVKKRGADVLHVVDGSTLPETGSTIQMQIDWDRRYRLMRTHTAMHVLCGVIFREFGSLVTGGNMALDKARMDFELEDLSAERVQRIEQLANDAIAAGLDVSWRQIPREEAFQIPDLIRTKINLLPDFITEVRVVTIDGLDVQADGGTHVRNTAEVGGLKITGTRSKGRINKRLEIALVD